ncbi:MAG: hypothetical protein ABIH11_05445 [Candidatus Altiarchaeota archaeon]
MSLIDDVMERYRQLDEVDRSRLRIGIIGIILVIYVILKIGDSFEVIGNLFSSGKDLANQSVSNLNSLGK